MSLVNNLSESERIQKLINKTIYANALANNTARQGSCTSIPRSIQSGSGYNKEASLIISLRAGATETSAAEYTAIVAANTCSVATVSICPSIAIETIATLISDSWVLSANTTIIACQTLTIPSGKTLIIKNSFTLTNNGIIINNQSLRIESTGTIINNGSIINISGAEIPIESGTLTNNSTITNNGDIYCQSDFSRNGIINNKSIFINSGLLRFNYGGDLRNFISAIIKNNAGSIILAAQESSITNDVDGIIYNYNNGTISNSYLGSSPGTFTNNGILNSPTVSAGCGVGILSGIIANGIACPP